MTLLKPNFWKQNNLIVFLLWPLTLLTRLAIFLKKIKVSYKPKVNSICIGNIYLGGTGKTQLVIKINEILKKNYKVFVIKKDYKNQMDEQKLLKKKANLVLSNSRLIAVKKIKKSKKTVALFDDGLQDNSIKYNLSIVCFNSISSIGNGKLLPAGPLREDLSELKKYNAVFINGSKNKNLINKIKTYNNKIKIFYGKYFLKNKNNFNLKEKYLAFCGIGTPENFFKLLKDNKFKVTKNIIFPDHFNYTSKDIDKINKIANQNNLRIVTTEKDYMKVKKFKNFKVRYTDVDLNIEKYYNFKKFLVSYL